MGIVVSIGSFEASRTQFAAWESDPQIIADHTVVAAFDTIPERWLDEVKKMQVGYIGESHSKAIGLGLNALESADSDYQVTVANQPAAETSSYLRNFEQFPNGGTNWGNLGEYEWYKNAGAISNIESGIDYINDTMGYPMDVFGFGWCWDPDEEADDMVDYIAATKAYIEHCRDNDYPTTVIFTTGPVDGENASGETGYEKYLAYEAIRTAAASEPSGVLFDFADILSYDDDAETPNTATWDGHTYPIITTTNLGSGDQAHMSSAGTVRLAKAIWWLLARVAGWNGVPEAQSSSITGSASMEFSCSAATESALLANLVAYFDFDEASGTLDNKVNNNNGTAGSGVSYEEDAPNSGLGSALGFDGSSTAAVTLPDDSDFAFRDNDFTMGCWFYASSSGQQGIFGGQNGAVALDINGAGSFFLGNVNTAAYNFSLDFVANQWNFIAISFINGQATNNATLYLNGETETITANFNPTAGAQMNLIGQDYAGTLALTGYIDEVFIYKGRALTEEELDELYNNGDGLPYPF